MREHKGRSIISTPTDYVAVDIETTGFSPEYCEIIEIGCIRIRNGKEVDSFSCLVRPDDMDAVDGFITKLTGITPEMLEGASPISEILPAALQFIDTDIVVGHNVSFDVNFIYDNAEQLGLAPFSNDYIDTMRLSRRVFPDLKNHRLNTLIKEFGIPKATSHRAESDARQTHLCFEYLRNHIDMNNLSSSVIPSHSGRFVRAANIVGKPELQNADSPIFGRTIVFTGALERMTRKDAMQVVADLGGINGDSVTRKTNFLVLGNNDMCASIKGGKSSKHKKAEQYILDGADLIIISENEFYEMVGEKTIVIDSEVPAQSPSESIPLIQSSEVELSELDAQFIARLSAILSLHPNFSDLKVVKRSENYLSVVLGHNDFLRFKFTKKAKWVSLRLPSNLAKQNQQNPLFAAQKNKAQFHWKSELNDLADLDALSDFIIASCV